MNQLRTLILRNKLQIDISDDIAKWISYEADRLGIEVLVDFKDINVEPLAHKSFGVRAKGNVSWEPYGLDNIKPMLRAANIVPKYLYHIVVFIYDYENTELYRTNPGAVGHWTYFEELYPGTEFVEIATTKAWDKQGDVFRVITHEARHAFVNRCRRRNNPIPDVMDATPMVVDCDNNQPNSAGKCSAYIPYYKEFEPFAVDGNRAVQTILLKPVINLVVLAPELTTYIDSLKTLVAQLQAKLRELMGNKDTEKMIKWAEGIKIHEGFFVGSRSYRNNNPGNFRYPVGSTYVASLGAIGRDKDNFAIFSSYQKGWEALLQFLRDAKANQLIAYRKYATAMQRPGNICTLSDFFSVYAPAFDNNQPLAYAEAVAKHIGVTPDTPVNLI